MPRFWSREEEGAFSAPAAPSILMPTAAETGLRRTGRVQGLKTAISGGSGTQRAVRWQIATDSGFTALIADTGWRTADGITIGSDIWNVWPLRLRVLDGTDGTERKVTSGQVTYWRCRVRDTNNIDSAWSATIVVTFESAVVPQADYLAVQ